VRRIGVLIFGDENDPVRKAQLSGFTKELAELGWTDGRNVRTDVRAAGTVDLTRMFAKELVDLQPEDRSLPLSPPPSKVATAASTSLSVSNSPTPASSKILTATSSITGVDPVIPSRAHACRKARFIASRYSSSLNFESRGATLASGLQITPSAGPAAQARGRRPTRTISRPTPLHA
jgi:hypothetical protein